MNEDVTKGYYCIICEAFITKYKMDLECCEPIANKLVCDECAKKIALYVVEEF